MSVLKIGNELTVNKLTWSSLFLCHTPIYYCIQIVLIKFDIHLKEFLIRHLVFVIS